jgi:hypothetical protein
MLSKKKTPGLAFAALALGAVAASPAVAAPRAPSYLGTWLIAGAQPAPWVVPGDPSTQPYDAQLVGKTIVYEKRRIVAPNPLACEKPNYAIKNPPPEGLFQGGLTAPAAQAAALGFRGRTIRTLETGCEGWFEFHFVDASTAMFALDNMVYTIRRQ